MASETQEEFVNLATSGQHFSPPVPHSWSYPNVKFYGKYRTWSRQSRPYIRTLGYGVVKHYQTPGTFVQTTIYKATNFLWAQYSGSLWVVLDDFQSYCNAVEDEEVLDEARNACFDLAKGATWDFSVFAAEFSKTTSFVGSLAKGIAGGLTAFRQFARSPKRAFRTMERSFRSVLNGRRLPKTGTRDAASLWLQYRYAVMTGILDVKNMAEATSELLSPHKLGERVIRANRTAVRERPVEIHSRNEVSVYGLASNLPFRLERHDQVTVSAWMRVRVSNSVTWEASKLGLLNPVVTLYELTWLSFVADWVLDLGNYFERLTALLGLDVVDAGYQSFRRVVGVYTPLPIDEGGFLTTATGSLTAEASDFHRSHWPNPAPVWTPGIRMSTNRWIDAAALIRTVAFGRFKM